MQQWKAKPTGAGRIADRHRTLAIALSGTAPVPCEAIGWLVLQIDPNMNWAPAWIKRTTAVETMAAIRKKVEER